MNKIKKHKTPAETRITKTEVVCPNDTNPMGMLQSGGLVEWMDIAAVVCIQSHAEKICVTASIKKVNFNMSAMPANIITIKATITRAFNTSIEIFTQAFARHILAGNTNLISEAYFTFVALDGRERHHGCLPLSLQAKPKKNKIPEHHTGMYNALITKR